MSKTKLPLSNISCAPYASALFTLAVDPPYSSHTLRLEGCGRDELADQKQIFKATLLPAYLSRTPLLLHSHCFDANRVMGHRWLHNGEQTQCILGAGAGHKWQVDQLCLMSRVHQQKGWRKFVMVMCVGKFIHLWHSCMGSCYMAQIPLKVYSKTWTTNYFSMKNSEHCIHKSVAIFNITLLCVRSINTFKSFYK